MQFQVYNEVVPPLSHTLDLVLSALFFSKVMPFVKHQCLLYDKQNYRIRHAIPALSTGRRDSTKWDPESCFARLMASPFMKAYMPEPIPPHVEIPRLGRK